jgi:hypothetical protein
MVAGHSSSIAALAATLGAVVVAGLVSVSSSMSYADGLTLGHHPNDRANHHPLHEPVRENQAVVTQLDANAVAVSYWTGAPDGWHVVTTVSTMIGTDSNDTEQHAVVRFSATLAPGQEQLISVPAAVGERQRALRVRRVGDRIEMALVAEPVM